MCVGGVHLSLNNPPLSKFSSTALPLLPTLLVAPAPLRGGDILGLIPRGNSFHLPRSRLLFQTAADSKGYLNSAAQSLISFVGLHGSDK